MTILKTIGSQETIASADRMFAVCDAGWSMTAHYWAKDAEDLSRALPVALDGKPALKVPLIVAAPKGASQAFPPTELRLDFSGLADGEVRSVSLKSHGFEWPDGSEVVGEVRRFGYAVPANTARTGANEIRVEGISNKVKLAGADLWIRRVEKFPDKQSSS